MSLTDGDVLIDRNGIPWKFNQGYLKSILTADHHRSMAEKLVDRPGNRRNQYDMIRFSTRIRDKGLKPDEIVKFNYGPWIVVTAWRNYTFE